MKFPEMATYSMLKKFTDCRRAYKYRYIDCLVKIKDSVPMYFGSLIHEALEIFYKDKKGEKYERRKKVIDFMDQRSLHFRCEDDYHNLFVARTMMDAYIDEYWGEQNFNVIEVEKEFRFKYDGRLPLNFIIAGKIDGLVETTEGFYILEHKTASQITSTYAERLWIDFQIYLYTWALRKMGSNDIKGVIYNILQKPRIKRKKGETEHEFELRKNALIKRSKKGKTSAKRKVAETDGDYCIRLKEALSAPGIFHREVIDLNPVGLELFNKEMDVILTSLSATHRSNQFYSNRSACARNNYLCDYFDLCRSNDSPHINQSYYEYKRPHSELSDNDENIF